MKITKWCWLLRRSQYYPRERLRDLQWRLLSEQLDHCFNNVPYYRELFKKEGLRRKDFSCLDDLRRLPVLTKAILEKNNEQFKADNFEKYRPVEHRTSGTTDKPLRLYWDTNSYAVEFAIVWRIFSWSGYRLGEPFVDIRRQELTGHRWNWRCRGLEISADQVDTSMGREYARLLRKYKIRLWRGCPSGLILLIEALKKAGIDYIKPKYVYSIAENLTEDARKIIMGWTGNPVYDHYTQQEQVVCISQCSKGGYHIAPEYSIVEVLREDNTPAEIGEEGRIVGTGLHKRAFPILRYDTGDYGVISDRFCSCRRTLPLLRAFTGRSRCGCV